MSKKIQSIILGLIAIAIVVFIVGPTNLGGGSFADSYNFKSITSSNASSTAPFVIRGGSGVIGKVIIASSTASTFGVYEGTATSTGTLITTFVASAPEGEYTFDVASNQGFSLDLPATFDGSVVVTYK